MLTSLALLFLLGIILGAIFQKLKLPSLLGFLITGILISPHALNLLDQSLLDIAPDLRRLALVIILTRAGMSLNIQDLKKVGRPAVLMCFIPATFEIIGVTVLAPVLLGISYLEAAILGTVLAAVSPAVIVPRMISLMEKGYGWKHKVPQLILAGASVDDVYVIVLFYAFLSLATGGTLSPVSILEVPLAIGVGCALGIVVGLSFTWLFQKVHMRDSVKVLIVLSVSFLLLELEEIVPIPMSALLAIMTMGIVLKQRYAILAERLSKKYNSLWVGAEILLFVLVGVTVDVSYAIGAGVGAIVLVIGALVFRMGGVALSLVKTNFTKQERLFCMIAYTPKATVQAAIGTIPLTMGLPCGQLVLTIAVLSILITAPFGAIGVDKTYRNLLQQEKES